MVCLWHLSRREPTLRKLPAGCLDISDSTRCAVTRYDDCEVDLSLTTLKLLLRLGMFPCRQYKQPIPLLLNCSSSLRSWVQMRSRRRSLLKVPLTLVLFFNLSLVIH